jgi:uncharacterized integral membrane protein
MGLFDVAFLVASWQTPMVVVLAVAKLVAAVVCGGAIGKSMLNLQERRDPSDARLG